MNEPEWIGALRYDGRRDYRFLHRMVKVANRWEYESTTREALRREGRWGEAGLYVPGQGKRTTR